MTDDGLFVTYILSDPTVHDVLKALSIWTQENPTADKVDALRLISGDEIVDALQGFRQKVPKPDGNKHDETAYPVGDQRLVAFVYGRSAVSPFKELRNSRKFKNNHNTRLVVIFDDEPDALEPADIDPNTGKPYVDAALQAVSAEPPDAKPTSVP